MKYKLIITFAFIIITGMQLLGQPVSKSLAEKVAKNYYKRYAPGELEVLKQKHQCTGKFKKSAKIYQMDTTIENTYIKYYQGHVSYYVTNFRNGGFVIVSGDKAKGPVIAHSTLGSYDPNNLPPAFEVLMEESSVAINLAKRKKTKDNSKLKEWNELENGYPEKKMKSGNSSGINPNWLLTTEWGQSLTDDWSDPGYNSHPGIPTNSNCNCNHCSVGCVAVAQAQIMNYWGFAKGDEADFEWWNMPYPGLNTNDNNFNEEQEAVSYLLKRVGDEVDMNYCSNGCASTSVLWLPTGMLEDATEAFEAFGFNNNSIDFKLKQFHPYNNWVGILRNEIENQRPVMYGVKGHALVVDGYNPNNDNFHWNFGWNLNSANLIWRDFEDLPDDYGDRFYHCAIVGIEPEVSDNITWSNNKTISAGRNKTYYVNNNISAATGGFCFHVESNAKCSFIAGNKIDLYPGFKVENGGEFVATVYTDNMLKSSQVSGNGVNDVFDESLTGQESYQKPIDIAQDIRVFPNPTHGILNIHFEQLGNGKIIIFGIQGNLVLEKIIYRDKEIIDLSRLSNGMYIAKFIFNNKVFTREIIID